MHDEDILGYRGSHITMLADAPAVASVILTFVLLGCGNGVVTADTPGTNGGNGPPQSADSGSSSDVDCGQCTASAGTFSGANPFQAFIHVSATATDTKQNETPVTIEVQLAQNLAPITNATVTAGPPGKEMAATSPEPGRYVVQEIGYAPWWGVSIQSDAGSLTGIRLPSPSFHSVSLPSRPVAKKPALVSWTPNSDEVVDDVEVQVFDWSAQQVTFDQHVNDSGEVELPATVVNVGSTLDVQVRRAASVTLGIPDSTAIVDLTAVAEMIVP